MTVVVREMEGLRTRGEEATEEGNSNLLMGEEMSKSLKEAKMTKCTEDRYSECPVVVGEVEAEKEAGHDAFASSMDGEEERVHLGEAKVRIQRAEENGPMERADEDNQRYGFPETNSGRPVPELPTVSCEAANGKCSR